MSNDMRPEVLYIYGYFLRPDVYINKRTVPVIIRFLKKHTNVKGKLLCFHKYVQFQNISDGHLIHIEGVLGRCIKCGRLAKTKRAKYDFRLIM